MSYLQVKNHALLNYSKLEMFFALLKVRIKEIAFLRDRFPFFVDFLSWYVHS